MSNNEEAIIYEFNDKSAIEIKIPEELRKGYVNNLKKSYEFKLSGLFDIDKSQDDVFNIIGKKVIKK